MTSCEPCTSFKKDSSKIRQKRTIEKVMDCTSDNCRRLSIALIILNIAAFTDAYSSEESEEFRAYCYNTRAGMTIPGANYKRILNVKPKSCEESCLADYSCFGFEYDRKTRSCYLKSRSISGDLVVTPDTNISFCIDESDEDRDKLHDHIINGVVAFTKQEVPNNKECMKMCEERETRYYSWRPDRKIQMEDIAELLKQEILKYNDLQILEHPPKFGTCSCLKTLHGIQLEYDAFSGIIPLRRKHHRIPRRK
ncbi:unnamed protein product [Caenorhabditis angaria]|uniref:Apple domain-containing protein n=1 Tax=Caenorhabditis angaria TaxID=860376 RepID=A0A9P1MV41_9PELO|nr:unnamed protein product [Caenorhabditis angaria]